ncbi:MAG: VOC family protein [Phycisphaerae bacterium]
MSRGMDRRSLDVLRILQARFVGTLLCVLVAAFGVAPAVAQETPKPAALAASDAAAESVATEAIAVEAVGAIRIPVERLDRSVAFFERVLTFERVGERAIDGAELARVDGLVDARARAVRMRLGDEAVDLVEFEQPRGRSFPSDSRSNDRWFQHIAIIVSDMDRAYARLREHDVVAASVDGPQTLPEWNKNAAGIRAFYFRDPDGRFLEILQFPAGKGDAKWQRAAAVKSDASGASDAMARALFLGIDHTAIVVANTDASLRFYRDTLGMRVVGGSENHGPEQQRLNNVCGARLKITTLKAQRGPAIELLEYLQPRDGRPYPEDTRINDLLSWQVELLATETRIDPNAAAQTEARERSGVETGPRAAVVPRYPKLLRDPDGHVLRFVD